MQAGHSFREKIVPIRNGKHKVIQIKDVGIEGDLLGDLLETEIEEVKDDFFVRKNDVLFTTRGLNRRACFIDKEMSNTFFVAQIFALRDLSEQIEPAYLAWYINQKPAQNYLETNASGSYIQNIRKDILANLPVVIPPKETQRRIVEINQLSIREKSLVEQIQTKRDQVIEKMLLNAIKNGDIK